MRGERRRQRSAGEIDLLLRAAIGDSLQPPPPDLRARILADVEQSKPRRLTHRPRVRSAFILPFAAAACLAALIVVFWNARGGRQPGNVALSSKVTQSTETSTPSRLQPIDISHVFDMLERPSTLTSRVEEPLLSEMHHLQQDSSALGGTLLASLPPPLQELFDSQREN